MYIIVHIYVYIYICVYIYIYVYIYICIYVCDVYVYVYVYMYIYKGMYVFTLSRMSFYTSITPHKTESTRTLGTAHLVHNDHRQRKHHLHDSQLLHSMRPAPAGQFTIKADEDFDPGLANEQTPGIRST